MTKLAIALVLAAAAAGNAFADDIGIDTTPFTSTASRAQVSAELEAFRASGVDPWAIDHNPLLKLDSARTRAQSSAEYIQARDEVSAFTSEDSGSSHMAQQAGPEAPTRLAGQPDAAQ
jgi:hypothetical protein